MCWKKYIYAGGISLVLIAVLFHRVVLALPENDIVAREQLEQELKDVEARIKELEQSLVVTKGEKKTLANKIKLLKSEQAQLRLQITATTLRLKDLETKISSTQKAIEKSVNKSERLKKELRVLLRLMNQRDQEIFMISLASTNGLRDIFVEAQDYNKLSLGIHRVILETQMVKKKLDDQRTQYTAQQDDTAQLLTLKAVQQKALGGRLVEQADLFKETQGKEANYQAMISDTKKRASEIKSRIYELLGVGRQISFGEAVTIAQWVSKQTGVSTAFLLAILTQESNLGKNVGTCNRPGDPAEKSWKVVMKPERDQEPFLAITKELGRDPDITPVSCPMRGKNGNQLGWGGAMGPAQFIPSTWMGYKDKIPKLTGKSPANPWDIRDAFVAAALKLKDGGADGTQEGEWKAAMRYFSGSTNTKYRFYGDNVMALRNRYQTDIEDLNKEGI